MTPLMPGMGALVRRQNNQRDCSGAAIFDYISVRNLVAVPVPAKPAGGRIKNEVTV
jgi:hypothetical protein